MFFNCLNRNAVSLIESERVAASESHYEVRTPWKISKNVDSYAYLSYDL